MNRKNIATTIATILACFLFITIGSCFSAFLYKQEIVKVQNPKVVLAENMAIFDAQGDKTIEEIKLSTIKLGLKPATGEEDSVSNIPSTVTDKQGSEGVYSKFKFYAPEGAKVVIRDIKIESKNDREKVEEERKNICVAIKEIKDSSVNLEQDEVVLGNLLVSDERQEYTFLVWLCGKTGDDLEGSTISFTLYFDAV